MNPLEFAYNLLNEQDPNPAITICTDIVKEDPKFRGHHT